MIGNGVIVNGTVVLDAPVVFPEGTRVRVGPAHEFEDDFPHEPHDRANELAILRESIEDMKAGRTRPFDEAMAEIAAKHSLPPIEPE